MASINNPTTTSPSIIPPNSGDNGISFTLSNGWNVDFHPLLGHHHDDTEHHDQNHNTCTEGIILASIPLATLYAHDGDAHAAFVQQKGDERSDGATSSSSNEHEIKAKAATVALADYTARLLSNLLLLPVHNATTNSDSSTIAIQTMGQSRHNAASANQKPRRRRKNKMGGKMKKEVIIPHVLERTDCMVIQQGNNRIGNNIMDATLQFFLHATFPNHSLGSGNDDETMKQLLVDGMLSPVLDQLRCQLTSIGCYTHVACVVLQHVLRSMLQPPTTTQKSMVSNGDDANIEDNHSNTSNTNNNDEEKKADNDSNMNNNYTNSKQEYLNAVAFIADGSLLPRKSGRSMLPMSSPPAVPFMSPESDQLTRVVTVDVGQFWRKFLKEDGSVVQAADREDDKDNAAMMMDTASSPLPTTVTMRGMIIPRGVTLIVGGGYHGKSTLLQALCMGVYDNLPFDGRERCVSHIDAVSIRAEDGRYVNNANVSAFLTNLPSGKSINGASISSNQDTTRFSTKDASGSTSQAANVIEALEAGASTLLVDEDISAANFMARDGRMRAMIMDEPITPLLYRVNGLFLSKEHQVSTVVVVGGVGEWLDVADAVVLMKDYVAYDGLKKAQSVSYQFSYGHVQYGGRGVVHRLPWEAKEEKKKTKKAVMVGEF